MQRRQFWGIFFSLVLILTGCQDSNSPTAPTLQGTRPTQTTSTSPSDDTTGSEIVSPEYPSGTTVIVAIGDSLTYGKGSWTGGYPAKLQAKLQAAGYNVVVRNEGIAGETSPDTDTRFLETIAGAQMVLLMIGINDIINPVSCNDYSCNTLGHIESMLSNALISKVVPIVSTVTPIRAESYFEADNWNIRGLNYAISTYAAAQKITVVDNYAAILSQGNDALYYDANVHFNDQGYEVIAQQWYDAIVNNKLIKK